MLRGLFKLAVFILLAHALFRFVPPYWSHTQFESKIEERAPSWRRETEDEVRDLVLAMAQERHIPVRAEQIIVRRTPDALYIDLAYARRIEFIPGWRREWAFESNVRALMLTALDAGR